MCFYMSVFKAEYIVDNKCLNDMKYNIALLSREIIQIGSTGSTISLLVRMKPFQFRCRYVVGILHYVAPSVRALNSFLGDCRNASKLYFIKKYSH